MDAGFANHPGQAQQRRQSRAVVGNPGPVDAAILAVHLDPAAGGENRVQVRGQHQQAPLAERRRSRHLGQHVADVVSPHALQLQLGELLEEIVGAGFFGKGRRGDVGEFDVAFGDPARFQRNQFQRPADRPATRQVFDGVGRRIRFTRHSSMLPLAGKQVQVSGAKHRQARHLQNRKWDAEARRGDADNSRTATRSALERASPQGW